MHSIILPELGEGIKTATVARWCRQRGETVAADDDIVEVVTDKATFHVPAGCRGTLKEISAPEGAQVAVGATLAIIDPAERNESES